MFNKELRKNFDDALVLLKKVFDGLESECSKDEKSKETPKAEVSIDDVRIVLADVARLSPLSREGVKNLLQEYGASKLSEVDVKNYSSLKERAEELLKKGENND